MKRHDDSKRSNRLAVRQPVRLNRPPPTFRTEKQLTAPADRPVRAPAHAVAFTTAVAIRGADSVDRQTARAVLVDRDRAGSPPAIPPALPAIQTRCFADYRRARCCDPAPDLRRALHDRERTRCVHRTPSYVYCRPETGSFRHASGRAPCAPCEEVQMKLKEPHARAA